MNLRTPTWTGDTVRIPIKRHGLSACLPVNTPQIEVERTAENLLLRLEWHLAEMDVETVEVEACAVINVPKDWIEALKDEKAPAWLLKRWPVQRRRIVEATTKKVHIRAALKGYRAPKGCSYVSTYEISEISQRIPTSTPLPELG